MHQFGQPAGRRGGQGVCQEGAWFSRAVGQEARPAPRTPLVLHPEDLRGRDAREPRSLSCSHGPGSRAPVCSRLPGCGCSHPQSLLPAGSLFSPLHPVSPVPHGNCFLQPLRLPWSSTQFLRDLGHSCGFLRLFLWHSLLSGPSTHLGLGFVLRVSASLFAAAASLQDPRVALW